jgi:hypothetical protein
MELNLHEGLSGKADFRLFPGTTKLEAVTPETPRYFHSRGLRATATQLSSTSGVPKLCSTDPMGSSTSSHDRRGYISVMATLKFPYFAIKGIIFC